MTINTCAQTLNKNVPNQAVQGTLVYSSTTTARSLSPGTAADYSIEVYNGTKGVMDAYKDGTVECICL